MPNLDAIASAGVNGLMDPVEVGLGCGSDTAHLSLMGYNPRVYYRDRGAFESMGAGLAMSPGDIAFKVSIYLFILFLHKLVAYYNGSHNMIMDEQFKLDALPIFHIDVVDCYHIRHRSHGAQWILVPYQLNIIYNQHNSRTVISVKCLLL